MLPILGREMLVALRERRRFLTLALMVGVSSIIITGIWSVLVSSQVDVNTAEVGRAIFVGMAFVQLLSACYTGFLTARSVAGERERGTWDMIVTTPVRPARMILEKMASPVFVILFMLSSLIPCLSLCFMMGGVSPNEAYGTYAVVFGFAIVSTVLGLFCSSWCNYEVTAIRAYTACVFFVIAIFPILVGVLSELFLEDLFGRSIWWMSYRALALSPFVTLVILFENTGRFPIINRGNPSLNLYPTPFQWLCDTPWIVFLFLSIVLIAFLLFLTFLRLRRSWYGQTQVTATKRDRIQNFDIGPSPFSDYQNIVEQRELLAAGRSRFGRLRMRTLVMCGLALFLSFILIEPIRRDSNATWHIFCYAVYFVGSLIAATATSGAISSERARGTWDMLSATLMTPQGILLGKFKAGLKRSLSSISIFAWAFLLMIVVLGIPDFDFFTGIKANRRPFLHERPYVLPFIVLMLGCWMMQMMFGLFFSIRSKHTSRAQVATFTMAIVHACGGFIVFGIVSLLVALSGLAHLQERWTNDLFEIIAFTTPLTLMADLPGNRGAWDIWGAFAESVHAVVLLCIAVFLFGVAVRRLKAQTAWNPGTD